MLDAMLPHDGHDPNIGPQEFTQRAEEARQLERLCIQHQQGRDALRYNRRRQPVTFEPTDSVWVWTPIRPRGISEKLLKQYFGPYRVLRQLSDVTRFFRMAIPGLLAVRRDPRLSHVVRTEPYFSLRTFSFLVKASSRCLFLGGR